MAPLPSLCALSSCASAAITSAAAAARAACIALVCANFGSCGSPSGHTMASAAYIVVIASPVHRPKFEPPAHM